MSSLCIPGREIVLPLPVKMVHVDCGIFGKVVQPIGFQLDQQVKKNEAIEGDEWWRFLLGSPAASVAVNSSGTCLAAGYEDAHCLLYDLRARRTLQIYAPHADQIRSVRFSPQSNLLLSASYDQQVVITDLSGKRSPQMRLEKFRLSMIIIFSRRFDSTTGSIQSGIAFEQDYSSPMVRNTLWSHRSTMQCVSFSFRHPTQFSFATTSADQSCVVWASPNLWLDPLLVFLFYFFCFHRR